MSSIFSFLDSYVERDRKKDNKIGFITILNRIRLELSSIDIHPKVVDVIVEQIKANIPPNNIMNNEFFQVEEKIMKSLKDTLMISMRGESMKILDNRVVGQNKLKIIKIYGMYGAGKTTFCGKLTSYIKKYTKDAKFAVTSIDYKRSAGQKQLSDIVNLTNAYFIKQDDVSESNISKMINSAIDEANKNNCNYLIIDTPGCEFNSKKEIDIMKLISNTCYTDLNICVVDSMIGKVCYSIMDKIRNHIPIDGIVITKVINKGDIGSVLNARFGSRKPVFCISFSEKIDDISKFNFLESSIEYTKKIEPRVLSRSSNQKNGKFTNFYDLRKYLVESSSSINISTLTSNIKDKEEARERAIALEIFLGIQISIIDSMTIQERLNPSLINTQRIKRIAKGCGLTFEEVSALCRQVYKV